MYPWSYTGVRLPDWQEMQNVGNIFASAMERNSQGINYSVGSAPRTQYLAAGGSDDWARGDKNKYLIKTFKNNFFII